MSDFDDDFKVGSIPKVIETVIEYNDEEKVILETHGGTTFNKTGDVLNAEGIVIKTKAELDTPIIKDDDSTSLDKNKLDIDGIIYTINESGNAINDKGETSFTKEQLETMQEVIDTKVDIAKVYEQIGIQLVDDNNKPIEYDLSTSEGIASLVKDVKYKEQKDNESVAIDSFFKANPDLYNAHLYKTRTGTLDGFGSIIDYSKIQVVADNKDQHKDIIIQAQLTKGNNVEDAKQFAEYIIADGKSKDKATESLLYLQTLQNAEREETIKLADANKTQAKVDEIAYINSVKEILIKGEIGNLKIPEIFKVNIDGKIIQASKDDFLNYFTRPLYKDDKGNIYTEYERGIYEKDLDNKIIAAMLEFVGQDANQLVNKEANKIIAKTIKKLTSKPIVGTPINKKENKVILTD